MRKDLNLERIKDADTRDSFRIVEEELNQNALLSGNWRFMTLEIPQAVIDRKITHTLRFIPKDIIQTAITGSGAITWKFDEFTRDTITFTTTGPVKVRFFLGSYNER